MKTIIILSAFYDQFEGEEMAAFFVTLSAFSLMCTFFLDFCMNFIGQGYDFSGIVYATVGLLTLFLPILFPVAMTLFLVLEFVYIVAKRYVFKLEEK